MKFINKDGKETESPDGYELVAIGRGLTVDKYENYGSYQGEWLMLAHDDKTFFIFKDWFGSCSGCDAFQREFDHWGGDMIYPWNQVAKFIADYKPFLEIPREQFIELYRTNQLGSLFPVNVRKDFSEIDVDSFIKGIKLEGV